MLSLDQQNALREQYRTLNPGWRPATEVYADLVRANLRPSARVLDLGCGRGGLVEQLDHPLAQIVGVDPDWRSLREHRLPLPRVAGHSEALPLADSCLDVAFASWLLEHLPRPSFTLAQLARVLRPGGVFVFITPNRRHPLSALNGLLGRFSRLQGALVERFYGRAGADAFATYYRANTPTALQRLAAAQGLELEELHAVPDPTYLAFNSALFRLMTRFEATLPADRQLHLVGCLRRPQ
ncbi:MAG: methyltransferase domain-containing protein [Ardenticatenaceae bacterium]|nr:methyltransferase domain-containing protein [Anaerolineales bacterium]MCB8982991.1 methyltransferase domain-containing protein [Ardenticatenaceae bacterium]MCB8986447.1 methyltransferase domain-containing protein [Ardenticatenaceae bacterium]